MNVRFGPFVLEPGRLVRDGQPVPLQPKSIHALWSLVGRRGALVTRAELLAEVWPDVVVTDQSVIQCIRRIRLALDDDEDQPRFVETIPRRGYRFLATVEEDAPPACPGREAESAALAALLARARLVTVRGPGGVGKSFLVRTTLPYAAWVDAAGCTTAEALGERISASVGGAVGALEGRLATGLPAFGGVLVLDDIEPTDPIVHAVAGYAARGPRVVVTSRATLDAAEGAELELGPLAVPARPDPEAPALRLFLARYRELGGAELGPNDLASVLDRVRAVDGLPLGIELAAAHAARLGLGWGPSPPLDVPNWRRDAPARHRSLREAIRSSWDGLGPTERDALVACCTFEASFPADAARAVVGDPAEPLVWTLVCRSLLQRTPDGFRVLRPIREFVAEHVADRSGAIAAHAAWFASVGRASVAAALPGSGVVLPEASVRDVVVAVENALAAGDGRTAGEAFLGLAMSSSRRGPFPVVRDLAQRLLASPGVEGDTRVRVGVALASAAWSSGEPLAAVAALEDALALEPQGWLRSVVFGNQAAALRSVDRTRARPLLDQAMAVEGLNDAMRAVWQIELGNQLTDAGDPHAARRAYAEALAMCSSAGDHRWGALAASNLGLTLHALGELGEARRYQTYAIREARAGGDRRFEALALGGLAEIERLEGRLDAAEAHLYESLEIWADIGESRSAASDWFTLGQIAAARGDPAALGLVRQARQRFEHHGNRLQIRICDSMLAALTSATDAAFDAVEPELGALGGPGELGFHHVRHATTALARGDRDTAVRCLVRARGELSRTVLGPASELWQEIEALAARLTR